MAAPWRPSLWSSCDYWAPESRRQLRSVCLHASRVCWASNTLSSHSLCVCVCFCAQVVNMTQAAEVARTETDLELAGRKGLKKLSSCLNVASLYFTHNTDAKNRGYWIQRQHKWGSREPQDTHNKHASPCRGQTEVSELLSVLLLFADVCVTFWFLFYVKFWCFFISV